MSNTGFLITLVILIAIWISNAKPAKRAAAKRSAARTADKESERNPSSEHDPRNRDLVPESEIAEILIKEDSRIEDFEYIDTFAAVHDTSCRREQETGLRLRAYKYRRNVRNGSCRRSSSVQPQGGCNIIRNTETEIRRIAATGKHGEAKSCIGKRL